LKDLILVDTREQKPLWHEGPKVVVQTLVVGDYTTARLVGVFHVERKSPQDLYGSIIQGHSRFRNEISIAAGMTIELVVFVECTKQDFLKKNWQGGWFRKMKPAVLAKIISTLEEKYKLRFVWCPGREVMKAMILQEFIQKSGELCKD
jgi:ERCC4-type nuclease